MNDKPLIDETYALISLVQVIAILLEVSLRTSSLKIETKERLLVNKKALYLSETVRMSGYCVSANSLAVVVDCIWWSNRFYLALCLRQPWHKRKTRFKSPQRARIDDVFVWLVNRCKIQTETKLFSSNVAVAFKNISVVTLLPFLLFLLFQYVVTSTNLYFEFFNSHFCRW